MSKDRIIKNDRFPQTYKPGRIPKGEYSKPSAEDQVFFQLVHAVDRGLSHALGRAVSGEEIEAVIIRRCGSFPPPHEQVTPLLKEMEKVKGQPHNEADPGSETEEG